jgi:hypothetical protein
MGLSSSPIPATTEPIRVAAVSPENATAAPAPLDPLPAPGNETMPAAGVP